MGVWSKNITDWLTAEGNSRRRKCTLARFCACAVFCARHASQMATDGLIYQTRISQNWCYVVLDCSQPQDLETKCCACSLQIYQVAIQAIQPTKQPSSRCRIQEKLWEAFLQICERRILQICIVFAARTYPKYTHKFVLHFSIFHVPVPQAVALGLQESNGYCGVSERLALVALVWDVFWNSRCFING